MRKKIYSYAIWVPNENMDKVLEDLEELYKKGWEVISHSQGSYGMTVLLKRK
jgi:hypothetical protein